jgi:hypothetical protein
MQPLKGNFKPRFRSHHVKRGPANGVFRRFDFDCEFRNINSAIGVLFPLENTKLHVFKIIRLDDVIQP